MKKLTSILIVFVFILSISGCSESSLNKKVQQVNHTPRNFDYITFETLPEGCIDRFSKESYDVGRGWYGAKYISYDAQLDKGKGNFFVKYMYMDDGRQHGQYLLDDKGAMTDKSEYLNYIRDSSNEHWSLYHDGGVIYRFIYGSSYDDGFEVIMFPKDKNVLGYITITVHYGGGDNMLPDDRDELLEDALGIADGISKSTLDRNAFNERVN